DDFSFTHNTTAFSGGLRYNPTISTSFLLNCGSLDSLKVSVRWGVISRAFQIFATVDLPIPQALAMVRTLQRASPFGEVELNTISSMEM
ncbi:hypothetical protein DF222_11475, partial [Corynebacterium yudongzhengii]